MNLFTRWKDKAQEYIDAHLGLIQLGFIERVSLLLGNVMIAIICLFISLAFFIFFGLGLVETFAAMLDSRVGGSFMTAGIFALMLVVLFLMRNTIIAAFAGVFIRILTEDDEVDVAAKKADNHIKQVEVEGKK